MAVSAESDGYGDRVCRSTSVSFTSSRWRRRSPRWVSDNWQVKDALVSKVSVDARGYNQFTVGDVSADAHQQGKDGDDATSSSSTRASTHLATGRTERVCR